MDTVIIGVSPDTQASHQAFIAAHNIPFPLLCDPHKKIMETYGAFGEKKMDGKVVMRVIRSSVWIGPDGMIRKHWRQVADAAEHPAKVLAALKRSVT